MTRHLLFILLIFFILLTIIYSKSQCSCSCCNGNRCVKRYQGSINMPTCTAKTCQKTCKLRYPGQCGRSPGTVSATCTKTKKHHRLSPIKKIKQKILPSKKHVIHRNY